MIRHAAAFLLSFSLFASEVPSPAGPGAAEPHLFATHDGAMLLSWLEGNALKFAEWRNGKWSAARTIVQRDDLFVNWADFPSLVADRKGVFYAHWLQKSGPGTYSYDVRVAASRDRGKTWSAPQTIHRDGTKTEHGFASLVPLRGGGIGALWLDGRKMTDKGGPMTVRYATFDGSIRNEALLDPRVCECCTTSMAMTSRGLVAAYRDRSEGEIRDISVVRQTANGWSKPAPLHRDGWKIEGCPVNGPQLDARETRVVAAWFTGADNQARVFAAFSTNAGATFGKRIRIDAGAPAGRVDVVLLPGGAAVVAWIEGIGDAAKVAARRVAANGALGEIITIAPTSIARGSGFPRLALLDGEVWAAWTDPGTPKRVRVGKMRF